jgi:hypothetical protein
MFHEACDNNECVNEMNIKYRERFWELTSRHPLGGQVVLVQKVNLEWLECPEHQEREEFLEARENEETQD